jgi:hypothetical protein
LAQPEVDLADALELGELAEHQPDRLAHAQVGVERDAVVAHPHVADSDVEEEFAAARFLPQCLERALAQDGQLQLAHRALHAEQQPVVRQPRVVDAVLVREQASDQAAELQQRVPVAAIPREARRFDREHHAGPPLADRHQQPLEARPLDPTPRAAEVVVDHLDR